MWLDDQVTLYNSCNDRDNCRPATFREIFFTAFAVPHTVYGIEYNDLDTIIELRKLGPDGPAERKDALKKTLQAFTPAGLMADTKTPVKRTGMLQLDFDYSTIHQWDIDSLKRWVFDLPFVAYCSLSASGTGFFALVLIAEPERLNDYADHLFAVFKGYGVSPDTSKGRNVNDLRFVSYDSSPLIRDNPEPLKVIFKPKIERKKMEQVRPAIQVDSQHPIVKAGIDEIGQAMKGQRWATVQKVAFTLGGLCKPDLLALISEAIKNNSAFAGQEDKYLECARVCFNDGIKRPLIIVGSAA